ncbi:MAG: NAD/NADP octopine/nopaline dehydrogenase family protein, partial [Dehalococcoidia bacterium]|nr:NAD/NADP octopine/nopaline dehydrogenase family protein [Dehalococcoidia bacterium]
VIDKGNKIEIVGKAREGTAKIMMVTTDIAKAVKGVELINIVMPAYGHENWFKHLMPVLENGQIICMHPGNYGSLRFKNMMNNSGFKKKVIIGDSSTLVYTCRKFGPAQVRVNGFKQNVGAAALPAKDTPKLITALEMVIPGHFVPAKNVLEIGLENVNPQFHTPIMVLNAGRIEDTKGEFLFYIEGATPTVSSIVQKLSDEKIAIGRKLGFEITDPKDSLRKMYGAYGKNMWECFQNTEPYHDRVCESAPSDLKHRYLSEDTPYGLVPISSLGKQLKVPTPVTDLFIEMSSLLNEADFKKTGLTTEKLGLAGLSEKEIVKKVTDG